MKNLIIFLCLCIFSISVYSQGCIIVRNVSGLGQYNVTSKSFSSSDWQLSINNRYFRAYRDYKGKTDLKIPPPNQNVIISFSMDFGVTRLLPHGWSLDLGFPISANSRTTNSEHGGPNTTRHTTSAYGIGDLQLTALKWLLKPSDKQRGNIQLGLGIKFPTGDFKKQGYFYKIPVKKASQAFYHAKAVDRAHARNRDGWVIKLFPDGSFEKISPIEEINFLPIRQPSNKNHVTCFFLAAAFFPERRKFFVSGDLALFDFVI